MKRFANIIGNISPYHLGHQAMTNFALQQADEVIFHIGSANIWPHHRTIFTANERAKMIRTAHPSDQHRIHIHDTPDMNNDADWCAYIQQNAHTYDPDDTHHLLIGHDKDASSYYLHIFPAWTFVPMPTPTNLSATQIRNALQRNGASWLDTAEAQHMLPASSIDEIRDWYKSPHAHIIENIWKKEQ